MDRTFDKGLVVGLGLVAALLVINAWLTYRNTHQLDQDAGMVAHTHEVLDQTGDVLLTLVDAETGQRGFLVTGKDNFLEPYNTALDHLEQRVTSLKNLTRDNERQQAHIRELGVLIASELTLLKEGIDLRRKNAAEAQTFVLAEKGRAQMDAIRRLVSAMEAEEGSMLQDRARQSERAYRVAVGTGLLTAILGLVLLGAFVYLLRRHLRARSRAAAILHEQRELLRTTLISIGDAVIATDVTGRVTFLNLIAQTLTGWKQEEASGQPLETVFRIVNEKTGKPAANPALRALREGTVIGLANHTALIARDGTRRPIDDSAAPIRDKAGRMVGVVLVFRDVTERRRSEEQLREAEERFRTLANSIPQLAWTARPDGYIVWYNRRWYEYTGTTPEQMEGWGWQSVHDPKTLPTVLEQWQASLRTGDPFEMVFPLRGGDGTFRSFLTRVIPLRGPDGQVAQWFGTNTDVTAIKEMEEALREADQRKDEFLATLAHELRNPLAPIRNVLQIMRTTGADAEQLVRLRDVMERQLEQLVRLVDDLLDVSRITRGKIDLRKERLDVAAIVRGALETSRPLLEAGRHQLTVELPPRPLYVEGDRTRLIQALANLLNNAGKYTPEAGHVVLTVEPGEDQVVLRVRDDGVGIPQPMLARIFDMFTQVDRDLDRSRGGLGIGLTLVRRLVEMHGGSIEAFSDGPGKGSEFVVRLPLWKEDGGTRQEEPGQDLIPPSSFRLAPLKVLVVDDNVDSAQSLAVLLRLKGNEVRTAYNGPAALEEAVAFVPDVMLLDLGMPGMSGYDLARKIRALAALQNVVLVAQTGWGQEEDRQRSKEAGFDHHLVKPLDVAELEKLLASLRPKPATA
jgi:PAS domain S-box-containing protein